MGRPALAGTAVDLAAPALPHLLLIGAYRDNEVGSGHALAIKLVQMQMQGAMIHTIALPPLGFNDVQQLLAGTLHVPAQTQGLAQLCVAKTGGNPFFLNQFLMTLAERDMLSLNAVSGSWDWERIRDAHITGNV